MKVPTDQNAQSKHKDTENDTEPTEQTTINIDAINGHREFHKHFTIPYTGDASVEAYNKRVEAMHNAALPRVNVPVLAMLAEV